MVESKTILYVDDDADDREIFSYAFENCDSGLNLKTAEGGIDALEKLESEETPCAIYIDINMPKMNGMEFLRIIKSHHKYATIPAFIFSTTLDADSIKEAKELGAADVFVKPTTVQ